MQPNIWETNIIESTEAATSGFCMEDGCGLIGSQCGYVDGRGRQCEFCICILHEHLAEGQSLCRRHATMMDALAVQDGIRPDIDDRSASLVAWIAGDIDQDVRRLLGAIQLEEGGEIAGSMVNSRFATVGAKRERRWHCDWKLISHTGILTFATVAVDVSRPDQVIVIVDGEELARLTPPWISHRSGNPDERARDRVIFYNSLLKNMQAGMERRRYLDGTAPAQTGLLLLGSRS
jgi:hypothetical protein